jgi:hypothetical protein
VGTQPALKVFEEEIVQLKKQVDDLRKQVKSLIPGPSAADLLNRLVGKKARFILHGGAEHTGTLAEHDRYNCLIQTDGGPIVLLKHAMDAIQPLE